MRRWIGLAAIAVLIAYGSASVALRLTYRRLLYATPSGSGRPRTDAGSVHVLVASDGTAVHVWDSAGTAGSPTVVLFHGNGETMANQVDLASRLTSRGLSVRLVEYRGYGLSRGSQPTERTIVSDAETALTDLNRRGVRRDQIILWGISLGTGVAIEMARRGLGARLVLISPYKSIPTLAASLAPGLPIAWIVDDRYDNAAKAPEIREPTLIVHGDADEVVPVQHGRELAARIPSARLEVIRGAHHNDLLLLGGNRLLEQLVAFCLSSS